MNILVTGGAGFIGSHTCVALCEAGHSPIVLDDLRNSDPRMIERVREITKQNIPLYTLDAGNKDSYETVLEHHPDISGIIHFAALKSVGDSVAHPLEYYRNNILSLLSALEAAQTFGIRNFVFSSSATVYGESETCPVTEMTARKEAVSPYGNTKTIGEDILRDAVASKLFPLKAFALRYFNPIGAHESGKIGELPSGTPANLLPYLLEVASGKREKLRVFGDDYPTPDGTGVRDYLHVMDLAQAHVAALEHLFGQTQEHLYDTLNVGTGKGTSVKELITLFELVTGTPVPHEIVERRPGDISQSWADASKIGKVIGWQAQKTIEQALTDAWRWEQSRSSLHSTLPR